MTDPKTPKIKVWDLPTRLFHWALPICLIVSYISVDDGNMELHQLSGLTLIGLLVFRVVWGVIGSETSRFAHFVQNPLSALAHLKGIFRAQPTVGHNPAGGWMVIIMLLALAIQAVTGLYATDDILFSGPLAPYVSSDLSGDLSDFHHLWNKVILTLVGVHIAVIVFYFAGLGDDLVGPMIFGSKRINAAPPTMAPLWRLFLAIILATLLPVWLMSLG